MQEKLKSGRVCHTCTHQVRDQIIPSAVIKSTEEEIRSHRVLCVMLIN